MNGAVAWVLDPMGPVRTFGPSLLMLAACAVAVVAVLWPRRRYITPTNSSSSVVPFVPRSFTQPAAKGFARRVIERTSDGR